MKAIFCAVLLFLCLTASAGGAEFTGITMGLGSTSWNTQLPAAVAQQAGFFKEQGLDVRAVTIASGGPVMMALLSSGEAQVIIAGAVAILRGIASGAPAVIIGGEMDKPDYALIGAKGLKNGGGPQRQSRRQYWRGNLFGIRCSRVSKKKGFDTRSRLHAVANWWHGGASPRT